MIKTTLDKNLVNKYYKSRLLLLKDNWETIRNEMLQVPIERFKNFFNMKDIVDENENWIMYPLYYKWKPLDFEEYAHESIKILKEVDVVNAGFSLFKKNTKTHLHSGNTLHTYRSHLGLDVPKNCGFKCKNKDLSITNGEINLFDALDIHEAWNDSDENRIILLVDFLKENSIKNDILRGTITNSNAKIYKIYK